MARKTTTRRFGNRGKGGFTPLTASERQVVNSIEEHNTVLPDQFFMSARTHPGLEAEKKLMIAVLMDAVKTYRKSLGVDTRRAERLLAETEAWFFEEHEHDPEWLYSFENICATLNIRPEFVRERLLDLRAHLVDGEDRPMVHETFGAVGLL